MEIKQMACFVFLFHSPTVMQNNIIQTVYKRSFYFDSCHFYMIFSCHLIFSSYFYIASVDEKQTVDYINSDWVCCTTKIIGHHLIIMNNRRKVYIHEMCSHKHAPIKCMHFNRKTSTQNPETFQFLFTYVLLQFYNRTALMNIHNIFKGKTLFFFILFRLKMKNDFNRVTQWEIDSIKYR